VRRSLIATVTASTVMVLVAMLVPMAMLVEDYAMEDRLAVAALELQGTETVVSGQDKGEVAMHVHSVNRGSEWVHTTVLYPDGSSIGPMPGEDDLVRQARQSGRARVDDIEDGAQILVPVSLGGSSALPESTPVIRVIVLERNFGPVVRMAWTALAVLGLLLLLGSVFVADRLGRSFVQPIRSLATAAGRLAHNDVSHPVPVEGPSEVKEVGVALNRLVHRISELLQRERESVADLSHRLRTPITSLRLGVESLPPSAERHRLSRDVDSLQRMVDSIVDEARRSQREGLHPRADATAVVSRRAEFWRPLAEDQDRPFSLAVPDRPVQVATSSADLEAALDALLENIFSHTPDGVGLRITLDPAPRGGAVLTVDDSGPGLPASGDYTGRGSSGSGSTGLGLDIVRRTAESTGGRLRFARSDSDGARVVVELGAAH
jgi:signal transduction histidine kinase